jgi:hypothetical protein
VFAAAAVVGVDEAAVVGVGVALFEHAANSDSTSTKLNTTDKVLLIDVFICFLP